MAVRCIKQADSRSFLLYIFLMKLNPHFKLRFIAGETIIVNQGTPDADLTRIISLNTSARLLWEQLSGKDFTLQEAALVLVEAYHIPQDQAEKDAAAWADDLSKCHILLADDYV